MHEPAVFHKYQWKMEIKQTQALLCNKLLVAHIFYITDLTSFQIGLKCKCKCVGTFIISPASMARNLDKKCRWNFRFFNIFCTILRLGGIQSFCWCFCSLIHIIFFFIFCYAHSTGSVYIWSFGSLGLLWMCYYILP